MTESSQSDSLHISQNKITRLTRIIYYAQLYIINVHWNVINVMYIYIMLCTIKPTYLMTVYCLHGAAPIGLYVEHTNNFLLLGSPFTIKSHTP